MFLSLINPCFREAEQLTVWIHNILLPNSENGTSVRLSHHLIHFNRLKQMHKCQALYIYCQYLLKIKSCVCKSVQNSITLNLMQHKEHPIFDVSSHCFAEQKVTRQHSKTIYSFPSPNTTFTLHFISNTK